MFVPKFGKVKKAVCLYRILAKKSNVFVPNFGKEKQCVLVLNFGKEKQRAFVPRFGTELWHRRVIHLYDKRRKAVCIALNSDSEKS